MSFATLDNIRDVALRAAIDVAWAQWSCLTHSAASADARPVSSIVDAEALVLLSLCLSDKERRLRDLLAALARSHSRLLSVHRMQHLSDEFPNEVQPMIHLFASWAKHPTWAKLGKLAAAEVEVGPRKKDLGQLRLLNPPALQLRLRTALGIGLKSDLLCYLLGQRGRLATAAEASSALGYTERNTRIAADDLVDAGFAVRDDYSPHTTYVIRAESWTHLLFASAETGAGSSTDTPHWRNWSALFSFLAQVLATVRRAQQGWSDYVIESRARDLVEEHYPRLIRARVLVWNGQMARESSGLDSLRRIVDESVSALQLVL
jgi:hypothetical protein